MSGLEIAGLVLGAFPIILRLLDDYRETAEALGDWWQIRRAYEEWKHDLDYHRTAFELNSKLILTPLISDAAIEELLDNPTNDGWSDQDLETRLKERLPDTYETAIVIIHRIYSLLEDMKKDLGAQKANFQVKKRKISKGKAAVRSFFDFQKERFRLVSKRESRKRLSAQLKEANGRLQALVSGNDQVEAARKNRNHVATPIENENLQDYWRHTQCLYLALSKATCASPGISLCPCTKHVANLQLATKDPDKTEFCVMFSGVAQNGSLAWNKSRIEMIPKDSRRAAALPGGSQERCFGFAGSSSSSASASEPSEHLIEGAKAIQSLCAEFSKPSRRCMGFIDEDEQRFIVYPDDRNLADQKPSMVSLDSLLHHSQLHTSQPLTRHRRYRLAHTIATWFLRLGSTPWINLPFKVNIMLLKDKTSPRSLDIEEVYIGVELSSYVPTPALDAIRGLGICLLELCFGYSLEIYKERHNLSGGVAELAPLLDYAAAVKWNEEVYEEADMDFAEAIKWCLAPRPQNDDSWRKEIWENVILPLYICSSHISRKLVPQD